MKNTSICKHLYTVEVIISKSLIITLPLMTSLVVASTLRPCGLCTVMACRVVAVWSCGVSSCGRVELCRVEL